MVTLRSLILAAVLAVAEISKLFIIEADTHRNWYSICMSTENYNVDIINHVLILDCSETNQMLYQKNRVKYLLISE